MGGFCNLVDSLQAPNFANGRANSPKVSGYDGENSRFGETDAGDRVWSPLRGGACSAPWRIAHSSRRISRRMPKRTL